MTIEQLKNKMARLKSEMDRIEDERGFSNVPSNLKMEMWELKSALRAKQHNAPEMVDGVRDALASLTIRR